MPPATSGFRTLPHWRRLDQSLSDLPCGGDGGRAGIESSTRRILRAVLHGRRGKYKISLNVEPNGIETYTDRHLLHSWLPEPPYHFPNVPGRRTDRRRSLKTTDPSGAIGCCKCSGKNGQTMRRKKSESTGRIKGTKRLSSDSFVAVEVKVKCE